MDRSLAQRESVDFRSIQQNEKPRPHPCEGGAVFFMREFLCQLRSKPFDKASDHDRLMSRRACEDEADDANGNR
jgi:hypothetical protein